jgi:hypothetical protein
MTELTRKPMIDRLTALLAGPFLLGRRALSLDWADAQGSPPQSIAADAPARIVVTSPEHAIKRRG